MRRRLASLAVVVAMLTGCAPTRIPVSEVQGFDELNQRASGQTAQVVLASGTVIHARNIHVSPDSLSWTSHWTGELSSGDWTDQRGSVPTVDVQAVKIHRTGRGVLKGLLYGGGAGLVLAGATHSPGWLAGVTFAMKTTLGALIGVVAWATTDEDVYEFTPQVGIRQASGVGR